ncbi:MAG: peptidoglycan DD-metalloendopeptidase family protein [Xanthomonadales bacterium]|nr:peptidoglycan DD-metalloendopeptidase family protein [Xanthomonadales bacterium]
MLLIWLCAALAPGAVHAQDQQQVEQQLRAVVERISQLEQSVSRDTEQKDSVLGQLRRVEIEIGQISQQLREIRQQMEQQRRRLQQLQDEALQVQTGLGEEQSSLGGQLRTAYAVGRQPLFKMLLNTEDLGAMGRTLSYFRYYNQARVEQIDRLNQRLLRLEEIRRQIETVQEQLEGDRQALSARQQSRSAQLERRRSILAELEQRIGGSRSELASLAVDRSQLENLLARLRDLFADIPGELDADQLFSTLKGRLAWPVAGSLTLAPGREKPGGMDRHGALISAPRGTGVAAVSYGRVAFADWLRGFGLITIVDHGDGFMSLYAFNESLFKEVGDWVQAGETIASVGDSGGRDQPGLYFELRRGGSPVPLRGWFSRENPAD